MNRQKILVVLEVLCVLIFLYAAGRLIFILYEYGRAEKEYDELAEFIIEETMDLPDEGREVIDEEIDSSDDQQQPVYRADLSALREKNEDTAGWIILPDSKINYPIVKSKDNTEYLTRTFGGQTANSGAIFIDMNCEKDFSSKNTIIYGHNMKNGSMFRALNDMTDSEYFQNHHVFCIDGGNGFENYEVISCYATEMTNQIPWQLSFEGENSYETWLQEIKKQGIYECMDYDVGKNTITLSTCRGKSGGNGRFVVHLQKKD